MSFFVGHSLAAFTVFSFNRQSPGLRSRRLIWLLWLIVIASAPDADYIFNRLAASAHHNLRITHSIVAVLLLPLGTAATLFLFGLRKNALRALSAQAVCAGLSHLLLDLLVGVTPLPLFYPFSSINFKLWFGLLPSAGRVQLANFLFYRNLLIEIGILIPLCYLILRIRSGNLDAANKKLKLILPTIVLICFLLWAINLDR